MLTPITAGTDKGKEAEMDFGEHRMLERGAVRELTPPHEMDVEQRLEEGIAEEARREGTGEAPMEPKHQQPEPSIEPVADLEREHEQRLAPPLGEENPPFESRASELRDEHVEVKLGSPASQDQMDTRP